MEELSAELEAWRKRNVQEQHPQLHEGDCGTGSDIAVAVAETTTAAADRSGGGTKMIYLGVEPQIVPESYPYKNTPSSF